MSTRIDITVEARKSERITDVVRRLRPFVKTMLSDHSNIEVAWALVRIALGLLAVDELEVSHLKKIADVEVAVEGQREGGWARLRRILR